MTGARHHAADRGHARPKQPPIIGEPLVAQRIELVDRNDVRLSHIRRARIDDRGENCGVQSLALRRLKLWRICSTSRSMLSSTSGCTRCRLATGARYGASWRWPPPSRRAGEALMAACRATMPPVKLRQRTCVQPA